MRMFSKPDGVIVEAYLYGGTAESIHELRKAHPTIRMSRDNKNHDTIYAEIPGRYKRERVRKGQYIVVLPDGYLAARGPRALTKVSGRS